MSMIHKRPSQRLHSTRRGRGAVLAMLLLPSLARAQPRQPDGAELLRAIDRLAVVGHALYVAAHPDDENTRLLAWLENERLVRAAYLSLTRGDGGQNLIGSEQGPLLGLIRTQELLAARGVDGAEQLFTRARDFGYSKSPEETLAIWGRDEVLSDVVWAIRRFRPDVIITRFSQNGEGTHGHHTASAILAEEAFRRAADPKYHPEQLALAAAFQARRIVWNKSLFSVKPNDDLSSFLKLDIGAYNPVLGISYGEMAARSRSMHKSQGFGSAPSRGSAPEYFQLLGGDPYRGDLFDGVDLTWRRVPGGETIIPILARARAQFRADHPADSIPVLLEARAAIQSLADNPWKAEKTDAIDQLIVACAGLWLEAYAEDYSVVPGGSLAITAVIQTRLPASLSVASIKLPFATPAAVGAMPPPNGQPLELKARIAIPADLPFSNPYWLIDPPDKGTYSIPDQRLIGLPESPPALAVEFTLRAAQTTFSVTRQVAFKWVDPVAGERVRPIEITPAVTLDSDVKVLMFPDAKPRGLRITVKGAVAGAKGSVHFDVPAGWHASPPSLQFHIADKGGEQELQFSISAPGGDKAPGDASGTLRAIADLANAASAQPLSRGALHIDHPHIPIQALFPPAEVKLVRFDLKRTKSRIGYVVGPGDDVPQALRQVGYDVTLLSGESLPAAALDKYDALLIGVRAFNTDKRLPYLHDKLMDYVKRGGTMVVQYSTANRISKVPSAIGPYPFEIAQDRVTDEEAEVTFDVPGHALLHTPNQITAADFAGWVQERGLYFAAKWDDRYETVISMHDPFEPPRKGGLLAVKYGKGAFIYTGLAFFRQLPAGVPGAYRLFANLISYGSAR